MSSRWDSVSILGPSTDVSSCGPSGAHKQRDPCNHGFARHKACKRQHKISMCALQRALAACLRCERPAMRSLRQACCSRCLSEVCSGRGIMPGQASTLAALHGSQTGTPCIVWESSVWFFELSRSKATQRRYVAREAPPLQGQRTSRNAMRAHRSPHSPAQEQRKSQTISRLHNQQHLDREALFLLRGDTCPRVASEIMAVRTARTVLPGQHARTRASLQHRSP